jgi:polysaccharide chain length determinant protein (PEP-CTERM system associated)
MVQQRELTVEDYIAILRRKWPLLASLAVAGCILGLGIANLLPKRYTSQTLVLVEQPAVSDDYVKPVVTAETSERLATMQQEILSRARLEPVVRNLELYKAEMGRVPMEDLVGRLRATIEITPVRPMAQTRVQGLPGFTVSVTFPEPQLAQQICTTVTSMFMEQNVQLRQRQAEQTAGFLAKQLEDAKAKLDEQDARLAAFQRRYLGALPHDQPTNLNVLAGLTSQLDATTQVLNRSQQDKAFAESSLAQQRAAWLATMEGRDPQTQEQHIAELETELTTLLSKYTDNHPDVIRLKRDLAIARADAANDEQRETRVESATRPIAEPAEIQALRAQIHQLEQTIRERTTEQGELQRRIRTYQARVESLPGVEQEYKALTRDYETALQFHNELLRSRDQATMATNLERQQQSEQFRVLDPANLPDRPSFPVPLYFGMAGLVFGSVLGLVLTAVLEIRDTSLHNERDVESLLQLPVLAMVPALKAGPKATKPGLAFEPITR